MSNKRKQQSSSPPSSPRVKRREIQNDATFESSLRLPNLEDAFEGKMESLPDEVLTAIGDVALKHSLLLGLRCASLARRGKFADAHRDAELMVSIAPCLAQSYLCKGNVYAMEARYAAAIRVYEKGLIKCARTDAYYEALKRAMRAARIQNDKRVDFIAKLPKEILPRILGEIFFEEILDAIYTSKTWLERITYFLDYWREIELYSACARYLVLLPRVGKHAQTINCSILTPRQERLLLSKMTEGHLTNLRKLDIHSDSLPLDQFALALWNVRHTLTDLTIVYQRNSMLRLASILVACPNLVNLFYSAPHCDVEGVAESTFSEKGRLRSLTLLCKSIPTRELEAVLRWSPGIKSLRISGCKSAALSVVQQTLPDLKELLFNVAISAAPPYTDEELEEAQPGLRRLLLPRCPYIKPEGVFGLLEKSQDTLEDLQLRTPMNMAHTVQGSAAWNVLKDLNLPALESLTLSFDYTLGATMVSLLRQCPSLRVFRLSDSEVTPNVFEAMKSLEHLEDCSISNPKGLEYADLIALFAKHAALGSASPLKKVSLTGVRRLNNDVLVALARITTLEAVEIASCQGMTSEGLEQFVKALGEMPNLEHVGLSDMNVVTDKTLELLGQIDFLRKLELRKLPRISDRAVANLAANAVFLQTFVVANCPTVSRFTLGRIQRNNMNRAIIESI